MRSLQSREKYERQWMKQEQIFGDNRTKELREKDNYLPSCSSTFNGGGKPIYPLLTTGESKSPVYMTMEEKTDDFMSRKRNSDEKYRVLIRDETPLQTRIQKWEVALRKRQIPITCGTR